MEKIGTKLNLVATIRRPRLEQPKIEMQRSATEKKVRQHRGKQRNRGGNKEMEVKERERRG